MTITSPDLEPQLRRLMDSHDHICPRQILGLRMGLLAGTLLSINLPQHTKRLIALIETDGCFADGVTVATGCSIGHRTMRLIDQGKVAVVFVDTLSDDGVGLRVWPAPGIRERARAACPDAPSRWHAQLQAYQELPDHELLCATRVELLLSMRTVISLPGVRAVCEQCGEEIINERERVVRGRTLCRHCAGESYFASPTDFGVRSVARLFSSHPLDTDVP